MDKMSEDEAIQTLRNHVCWVKSKNVKQAIETILDLYKQEKDSNQWLLKAFDESRNNNIELAKECCKIQEELKQEREKNEELEQEKEKNKELEKEMELNKEAIYLANNTICNYDIGYQDGLNKKMTATEIVAEQRKFMILGQKINQLENANYELHKIIDEGNKKVVEDYIRKDKIREIVNNNKPHIAQEKIKKILEEE